MKHGDRCCLLLETLLYLFCCLWIETLSSCCSLLETLLSLLSMAWNIVILLFTAWNIIIAVVHGLKHCHLAVHCLTHYHIIAYCLKHCHPVTHCLIHGGKSLMAEWLEQASQWHEMYYHDLELMSLNPGQVELGVHSTYVLCRTWTKDIFVTQCLKLLLRALSQCCLLLGTLLSSCPLLVTLSHCCLLLGTLLSFLPSSWNIATLLATARNIVILLLTTSNIVIVCPLPLCCLLLETLLSLIMHDSHCLTHSHIVVYYSEHYHIDAHCLKIAILLATTWDIVTLVPLLRNLSYWCPLFENCHIVGYCACMEHCHIGAYCLEHSEFCCSTMFQAGGNHVMFQAVDTKITMLETLSHCSVIALWHKLYKLVFHFSIVV